MKDIITINIPDGYEFYGINDEGNITLTPKQIKYPESYAECCKVLGIDRELYILCITHKQDLMANFYRLLVCRDAYWKLADNWKPDWGSVSDKYTIFPVRKEIWRDRGQTVNTVLAFPTPEMREAFYENFKNLIEQCKELL